MRDWRWLRWVLLGSLPATLAAQVLLFGTDPARWDGMFISGVVCALLGVEFAHRSPALEPLVHSEIRPSYACWRRRAINGAALICVLPMAWSCWDAMGPRWLVPKRGLTLTVVCVGGSWIAGAVMGRAWAGGACFWLRHLDHFPTAPLDRAALLTRLRTTALLHALPVLHLGWWTLQIFAGEAPKLRHWGESYAVLLGSYAVLAMGLVWVPQAWLERRLRACGESVGTRPTIVPT